MPPNNHSNITLPRERHQQFLGLMDAAGARTASEMMGALIKCFVEQGRLEHTLPGVEINTLADGIALKIGDNPATVFPFESARVLADIIRGLADGTRKQGAIKTNGQEDDRIDSYAVTRKGGGIQIDVPFMGETKAYTPDVARDLADLIDRACA